MVVETPQGSGQLQEWLCTGCVDCSIGEEYWSTSRIFFFYFYTWVDVMLLAVM